MSSVIRKDRNYGQIYASDTQVVMNWNFPLKKLPLSQKTQAHTDIDRNCIVSLDFLRDTCHRDITPNLPNYQTYAIWITYCFYDHPCVTVAIVSGAGHYI